MSRPTKLIHYGSSSFDPEKFKPIRNNHIWAKPIGGLWTSPVDSEWGWKDWCKVEEFREIEEANSFTISLKPSARLYVIDSVQSFLSISEPGNYNRIVDWERLACRYDGVWLTCKGLNATKDSMLCLTMWGWDVESILIFNPNCIQTCH
jgi:hypothetical protein